VNVKTTNTPPKTTGPKSTHEFDHKSQRHSVDETSQPKKPPQPGRKVKEQSFESKIKMFMERNEVDRELEEKVKKRLIEISKCGVSQNRRSQWGVGSGWRAKRPTTTNNCGRNDVGPMADCYQP
jgi:hypothetical protein